MAQDCTNPDCEGGPIQTDLTLGQRICTACFTIVETNLLVSEISFGETSGGRATVNGTFISNASTGKAAMPGSRFPTTESSERVISNGLRGIQNFAAKMQLSGRIADGAGRIFQLAVNYRFNRGRPGPMVWASCLYLQCRISKNSAMLIDFSEELQINVFELGSTYLRLRKVTSLTNVEVIDPSIYITRFASLLEFGDDTQKVAHDAIRLVRRFQDDWIVEGRRPAGICGACILLAARMNNFRRSIEEIVQVVKIAEITVKKRLDEFSQTSTGQMSVADFMKANLETLEKAEAPPAFIRNRKLEKLKEEQLLKKELESQDGSGDEEEYDRTKKRRRTETPVRAKASPRKNTLATATIPSVPIDPEEEREDFTAAMDQIDNEEDPATSSRMANVKRRNAAQPRSSLDGEEAPLRSVKKTEPDAVDIALEDTAETAALVAEIQKSFNSRPAEEIRAEWNAIEGAKARRETGALEKHDNFEDLDDEELEAYYLMDEDESATKARVWVSMNKDYLVKLSERQQRETEQAKFEQAGGLPKRKRKAPTNQHKGPYASAGDAMKGLVANNRKFSSRLNYAALGELSEFDVKQAKAMSAVPEEVEPEPEPEPVASDSEADSDVEVEEAPYDPEAVADLVEFSDDEVEDEEEEY